MRTEIALIALAGIIATALYIVAPINSSPEFAQYKLEFGKKYTATEEKYRKTVFLQNLETMNKHNSESHSYTMGINQFSDMTEQEFKEKILMKDLSKFTLNSAVEFVPTTPILKAINWKDATTPVKNQGQCGSCWSFSTTGLLESTVYLRKKVALPNYSEQQLVDCCGKKGFQCTGCNGAWPEWAMNYVAATGIVPEQSYPYTAVEGACKVTSGEKILAAKNSSNILKAGDTNALKSAVSAGPVSICVDATRWSPYKSGVFNNCGSSLDHAVLLIGYEDSGNWIVKNSWGASWGEQGYIRLAPGNTCGIADHAVTANLA